MTDSDISPVFVLGSPRSGTTLIGSYIGSSSSLVDLQEFSGFYFTSLVAAREFKKVPSPFKGEYVEYLRKSSQTYVLDVVRRYSKAGFVDSTPWNILIIDWLASELTSAVFILCYRDLQGVVQSLERSFRRGYKWAGPGLDDRVRIWSSAYQRLNCILRDNSNIHVFDYDAMCAHPEEEISKLDAFLDDRQLAQNKDRRVFAKSFAAQNDRRTVAKILNENILFSPIASFDEEAWARSVSSFCQSELAILERAMRMQEHIRNCHVKYSN